MERLHVYVEGRVQGVGYRHGLLLEATRLGLNGWVRNLHDGRVEADLEGDRTVLALILEWCRRGPALARVTGVAEEWREATGEYSSPEIRF
ncbi:MAG: acylphosphatase [Candidatus Hydrogenedentota bacterium]